MRGVHHWLVPALWLAWAAYWLAVAAGAKPTARRESLSSRLGHVIPLAVGIWLLTPTGKLAMLSRPVIWWSPTLFWIGVALVIIGLAWSVWARLHLGTNWSGVAEQKQGHQLIRTGPYKWSRHPIYTGLIMAVAGSAITLDRWRGLLGLIVIIASFMRKLHVEERFMEELFPLDYARYRAAVPALLPWPGSAHRQE